MVSELKVLLQDWKERQPVKSDYLFTNMVPQSSGYGEHFVDRRRFMQRICADVGVPYFGGI